MEKMDIHGIRNMLMEEIVKLRAGNTTPGNVNAIVNATGKILTTVKMEMEYSKMVGITPRIDFICLSTQPQIESDTVATP